MVPYQSNCPHVPKRDDNDRYRYDDDHPDRHPAEFKANINMEPTEAKRYEADGDGHAVGSPDYVCYIAKVLKLYEKKFKVVWYAAERGDPNDVWYIDPAYTKHQLHLKTKRRMLEAIAAAADENKGEGNGRNGSRSTRRRRRVTDINDEKKSNVSSESDENSTDGNGSDNNGTDEIDFTVPITSSDQSHNEKQFIPDEDDDGGEPHLQDYDDIVLHGFHFSKHRQLDQRTLIRVLRSERLRPYYEWYKYPWQKMIESIESKRTRKTPLASSRSMPMDIDYCPGQQQPQTERSDSVNEYCDPDDDYMYDNSVVIDAPDALDLADNERGRNRMAKDKDSDKTCTSTTRTTIRKKKKRKTKKNGEATESDTSSDMESKAESDEKSDTQNTSCIDSDDEPLRTRAERIMHTISSRTCTRMSSSDANRVTVHDSNTTAALTYSNEVVQDNTLDEVGPASPSVSSTGATSLCSSISAVLAPDGAAEGTNCNIRRSKRGHISTFINDRERGFR